MKIRLSEILKSLRREKGNTQEELAQYLGISAQSVSKWEREEGYPDIALLPEIAGYYRVSVDCLLGVDERAREARVKEITDRYNALRRHIPMDKNYRLDEGIALLRESIRQIPGDFFLEQLLAADLSWKGKGSTDEKERDLLFREATELCEDIMARCTEDRYRACAREILLVIYAEQGKREEALALAYQCPGPFTTREYMMTYILTDKELVRQYKRNAALYYKIFQESVERLAEMGIEKRDMADERELIAQNVPLSEFYDAVDRIKSPSTRG